MSDKIIILDFGSQYTQLIARRIRELGVLSEIHPPHLTALPPDTRGLILSGGPASVRENTFNFSAALIEPTLPILGICFGMQLLNVLHKGTVLSLERGEFGKQHISLGSSCDLFSHLGEEEVVWMSHRESVGELAPCYRPIAHSKDRLIAAFKHVSFPHFGVQFHPEVTHTEKGDQILKNFVSLCDCKESWNLAEQLPLIQAEIRRKVGEKKVISFVSGGIDSTAATLLCMQALGPEKIIPLHIDTGLMRQGESRSVKELLLSQGIKNVIVVDASESFLTALKGVTDPETKRHLIGNLFIEILEKETSRLHLEEEETFLCQGTLYTDLIESGRGCGKNAAVIKTHHNVGVSTIEKKRKRGLIIEPNASLFKDEVRRLCELLGLPRNVIYRHPFPGPGLALRIMGEITPERLASLRQADHIYLEEIQSAGLYEQIWQAFALLLPIDSVGVMGDERSNGQVIALRAVTSLDGMTADFFAFSPSFLSRVSTRIINEVAGITRVVYDITSKPPGTIEWQ